MRLIDIVAMALANLWQRKLRTCLNLLGIVIGCTVLLLTAAGASGIRNAVQALFDSSEFAKEIRVRADYYSSLPDPPKGTIVVAGEMSEERRERIRKTLTDRWKSKHGGTRNWQISLDEIADLKTIEHVTRVVPDCYVGCRVDNNNDSDGELEATLVSVDVASSVAAEKIIVGKMLTDETRDQILINEVLAYDLGFRSDQELADLIGQELTITYQVGGVRLSSMYSYLTYFTEQRDALLSEKTAFAATFTQLVNDLDKTSLSPEQKEMIRSVTQRLPEKTNGEPVTTAGDPVEVQRTFRVSGVVGNQDQNQSITDVFRRWIHGRSGDLLLHHEVATELQSQIPEQRDEYHSVKVVVDSSASLKEVTEAIKAQGLAADSALQIVENIQQGINNGRWLVFAFAAAILLASALGISNTLVISVLQRTPEFGVLKAVGARDRDLVWLMLCEGVLLGVIGATLTCVIGWVLSLIGQGILAHYLAGRFRSELPGELFDFQLWPIAAMYGIAVVICVGASVLPAWRAARLDPVVAMRRT